MYEKLSFRIQGVSPLVMHNGQLADPLNKWAKDLSKISSKKPKTEADHAEMARLEWHGSLYLHDGKPCIPGELIEAAMIEGARKTKRGKLATAGILCAGNYLLEYDGPDNVKELWEDERFRQRVGVRIQRVRVMRTRPTFPEWAANIEMEYMPTVLNKGDIGDILKTVGQIIGIGDWRPRFGRFEVVG